MMYMWPARVDGTRREPLPPLEPPGCTPPVAGCVYLILFALFYGLAFSLPFWGEELASPTTSPPPPPSSLPPRLSATPTPSAGYFSSSGKTTTPAPTDSFHHIWRYSWEATGFAVRCLTLVLLLLGCVDSACQAALGHVGVVITCRTLPPTCPFIWGIVAGVMGLYAELLLGVGVLLLAPNPALTVSLVLAPASCLFGLLGGMVLARYHHHHPAPARNHTSTPAPSPRGPVRDEESATARHEEEEQPPLGGESRRCFLQEAWIRRSQKRRRSSLDNLVIQEGCDGSQPCADRSNDEEEEGMESEEEERGVVVARNRQEGLASLLGAQQCPTEDLPDDLKKPALGAGANRDDLLNRCRNHPNPLEDLPEDLQQLLPEEEEEEGIACRSWDLLQPGEFTHRDHGFTDNDDVYYHTSDDEHLERFIQQDGSSLGEEREEEEEEGGGGGRSGLSLPSSTTTRSSTCRLLHGERGGALLLLPFENSDELFHSFSDEDLSCKNRTWP